MLSVAHLTTMRNGLDRNEVLVEGEVHETILIIITTLCRETLRCDAATTA